MAQDRCLNTILLRHLQDTVVWTTTQQLLERLILIEIITCKMAGEQHPIEFQIHLYRILAHCGTQQTTLNMDVQKQIYSWLQW